MTDVWRELGVISKVNAARREVRVQTRQAGKWPLDSMDWLHVRLADDSVVRCKVVSMRRHGDAAVVVLAAGVTRDTVSGMTGADVVQPAEEAAAAGTTLQWQDVIDFRVRDEDGAELGTVRDAFETRAHGVLEIVRPDGGSILLPAIEEVLECVDVEAGVLIVRDITPYAVTDED